jgi:hypothetical protein
MNNLISGIRYEKETSIMESQLSAVLQGHPLNLLNVANVK